MSFSSSGSASIPSSSRSSLSADSKGSQPAGICPAEEVSYMPGYESLVRLRFCIRISASPGLCSGGRCLAIHTCVVRCRIPSRCASSRSMTSPVGSPFSSQISNNSIIYRLLLSLFFDLLQGIIDGLNRFGRHHVGACLLQETLKAQPRHHLLQGFVVLGALGDLAAAGGGLRHDPADDGRGGGIAH